MIDATEEGLFRGIRAIRIGGHLSDYGRSVQSYIEAQGFSVVRDLVGHGVGFELHEPPHIPNHAFSGPGNRTFCAGMAVALEPMINIGSYVVRLAPDGWAFCTSDGSLSAHFEDTVIITEEGIEVVTRSQWKV